jgi:hypothetical protein
MFGNAGHSAKVAGTLAFPKPANSVTYTSDPTRPAAVRADDQLIRFWREFRDG